MPHDTPHMKGCVARTLVINPRTQSLLLVTSADRPHVFELPGGKFEPGETPVVAALRELSEETGIILEELTAHGHYDTPSPYIPLAFWRHFLFSCTLTDTSVVRIDHEEIIGYRWETLAAAKLLQLEGVSRYMLERIRRPK